MNKIPEYYECHITFNPEWAGSKELEELGRINRFKMSAITGDEVLGDKRFVYLTSHDVNEHGMFQKLSNMTDVLNIMKIPYIRRKIEKVIFDERQ